MKNYFYIGIFISAALIISGCTTRLGHFTAASTQNVRNLNYSIADKSKQHVKGSTCITSIILLPFGHFSDRLERAMDDAVANGNKKGLDGDLLVNVRIDQSAWTTIIFGRDCLSVEGDLVKIGQ